MVYFGATFLKLPSFYFTLLLKQDINSINILNQTLIIMSKKEFSIEVFCLLLSIQFMASIGNHTDYLRIKNLLCITFVEKENNKKKEETPENNYNSTQLGYLSESSSSSENTDTISVQLFAAKANSLQNNQTALAAPCNCPSGYTEYTSSATVASGTNICANGAGVVINYTARTTSPNFAAINGATINLGNTNHTTVYADVCNGGIFNTTSPLNITNLVLDVNNGSVNFSPNTITNLDLFATDNWVVEFTDVTAITCFFGYKDATSNFEFTATSYLVMVLLNEGMASWYVPDYWNTTDLDVVNSPLGTVSFTANSIQGTDHDWLDLNNGSLNFNTIQPITVQDYIGWDITGSSTAAQNTINNNLNNTMTPQNIGITAFFSGCAGGNIGLYIPRSSEVCGDGIDNDYDGVVDCSNCLSSTNIIPWIIEDQGGWLNTNIINVFEGQSFFIGL